MVWVAVVLIGMEVVGLILGWLYVGVVGRP